MTNPDVREIVGKWLRENGYDGLFNDDCGCSVDDLMPCSEVSSHCEAGYKFPCPGQETIESYHGEGFWCEGNCDFHIGRKEESKC